MKLSVFLFACVAVVALVQSASIHKDVKYADKDFLAKQKFFFEILYRVEDPLSFEEYIKLGGKLVLNKTKYAQWDDYMTKFYDLYKSGAILPKGEFYGALSRHSAKEMLGLFQFFYYAQDWETFVSNVCWARIHVNAGVFVNALTLAVIHRPDCDGFILPSIYEIFPQNFFNSKFIYQAEKFDYNVWSKYVMYEKEYKDIFYENFKDSYGNYVYTKDYKTWQWWKLMGLGEHFYSEDKCMIRENYSEYSRDPKYTEIMKDLQMFWMPVDYTRDIEIFNENSKLSYFTEDLGWNAYWYYLNMDYPLYMEEKTYSFHHDRRSEWWIFNVQQILARYYMERLSHGLGDIEDFSWYSSTIETGYNPQLITYNGLGYSYRKNYYEMESFESSDLLQRIAYLEKRIYNAIDLGYFEFYNGTKIDLRRSESIERIGQMIQGNFDLVDKKFFGYLTFFASVFSSNGDIYDKTYIPNVFMNYETMLRDPMFYMMYKKFTQIYYRYKHHLGEYTKEELTFKGVQIEDVNVDKLVTYFDLVDFDATNLLNDKMTFADGKFVWDKTLLARQSRLNHKPFNFDLTVKSDKAQKVVIRTFIGPKFDEYGRTISLAENRENFMEIDEFTYELVAGQNAIKRNSNDFYWTVKDRTTYTELYRYAMTAYEGKYQFPLNISQPHCGYPDRLILPRGWYHGMPMQMFFIVTPYTASSNYQQHDFTYSCAIGSGYRYIDSMPFGYPFDRAIDEYNFYVPNMYFKDVKIYHMDKFEKYYEQHYENFGKFDYDF